MFRHPYSTVGKHAQGTSLRDGDALSPSSLPSSTYEGHSVSAQLTLEGRTTITSPPAAGEPLNSGWGGTTCSCRRRDGRLLVPPPARARCASCRPALPWAFRRGYRRSGGVRALAPTSGSRTRTCAGVGLAHAHGGGDSSGGSCRGLRAAVG